MNTYYFDTNKFTDAFFYSQANLNILFSIVKENNKIEDVQVWEDKITGRIYVKCENKPRDSQLYGIYWENELLL